MKRLLDIKELSGQLGRPVRQIRSFAQARKIPYMKLGHRSLLFDPEKVVKALARFEVEAVTAKNECL